MLTITPTHFDGPNNSRPYKFQVDLDGVFIGQFYRDPDKSDGPVTILCHPAPRISRYPNQQVAVDFLVQNHLAKGK